VIAAVSGRAAPLTAAGEAAGRGEETGRRPLLCLCGGWEGEMRIGLRVFQGLSVFIPHRFQWVDFRPLI
jgi:hypothetical protein